MDTLIAEDLLLLLLDDDSGKAAKSQELPAALGGALLVELALGGAVRLEPREGLFHPEQVHADGTGPADPLLADAFAVVREKPRKAQSVVEKLGKDAKEKVAARLVERGILERRDGRVLGLVPRTTWPARDRHHEDELRATLTRVLVGGQPPDEHTGAVVALLSAIDFAPKAVDSSGASKREIRARAKEIAEGDWAAGAVRASVQAAAAASAAAVAAIAAASVTTT